MRTVSDRARGGAYAEQTGDVYLDLLTIDEPSMSSPIRLVNNTEDIVSNGLTYTATAFRVVRPRDDGNSVPNLGLQVDNVSIELIGTIRAMVAPVYVSVELVLAETPDVIEIPAIRMQLREIDADALAITGKIVEDDWLSSRWPAHQYNMTSYRGLFK